MPTRWVLPHNNTDADETTYFYSKMLPYYDLHRHKKSQVLGEGRSVKILGSLLQQIPKGGFEFPHQQLAAALHFGIWAILFSRSDCCLSSTAYATAHGIEPLSSPHIFFSGFDDMMHMSDMAPGMGGPPPQMHGGYDTPGGMPNMGDGPPQQQHPPHHGNNFMSPDEFIDDTNFIPGFIPGPGQPMQ